MIVEREFEGDFVRVPVERVFLNEAGALRHRYLRASMTPPTWTSPTSSARWIAKVAQIGDEGDPRARHGRGVYAASRGVLEMIEILKVKREFLYLLLTLTQEKNVKVSRFPLIQCRRDHLRAHLGSAEFYVPAGKRERGAAGSHGDHQGSLCLSYRDESRIYHSWCRRRRFRNVHLDPHVLNLAAVFGIPRPVKPEREGLDVAKKLRIYAGEAVEGMPESEAARLQLRRPTRA